MTIAKAAERKSKAESLCVWFIPVGKNAKTFAHLTVIIRKATRFSTYSIMKTLFEYPPDELAAALSSRCKVMKRLVEDYGPLSLQARENAFVSLVEAILSQQLSTKAAATIIARFYQLTGGEPTPDQVLSKEVAELRSCGISGQKAGYLHDLALHFRNQPEIYTNLHLKTDEEVIHDLVRVKGIGVWSAQMFLIFSLGRKDVFPADDLGIRNAIRGLYEDAPQDKNGLVAFSERWLPLRSAASLYLWKSLNNKAN